MKLIKMVSPNGKTQIMANPIRVDHLKANGWKEPAKTKPAKAETKGDK